MMTLNQKYFTTVLLVFISLLIYPIEKQVPYNILLDKPVRELTFDQIKATMLRRLNELREEETRLHPTRKLKPLKYSKTVERAAFFFMDHKTKWFKEDGDFDAYCHFDDENNGPIDRYKMLKIKYAILSDSVEHFDNGGVYEHKIACVGENVVTANTSVYKMCEAWKKSPGHWVQIINKYYTHIGIGYRKDNPVLICDFIRFDTPLKSTHKRR